MKLPAVFESILTYLDKTWEKIRNNNTIGNAGQAVVILAPTLTLTDEETKQALAALSIIKEKHPGKVSRNDLTYLYCVHLKLKTKTFFCYRDTFPVLHGRIEG